MSFCELDQNIFPYTKTISAGKCTLFLVKSTQDCKYHVLKIFAKDPNSIQSCIHEHSIHSSITHPNIISYVSNQQFSVSLSNFEHRFISMEYAPYGDFFNLVLNCGLSHDEKLVRTFFHQLIEGLQYLHSRKIAHLDLKLENLLLGEDFLLKIADFDLAQKIEDNQITLIAGGGTTNYRAPEILLGNCVDYEAADVYSAGICLYALLSGSFPFLEEERENKNYTLFRYDTFMENNEMFWAETEELMEGKIDFSVSFKELVNKMLVKSTRERMTLEEIKQSKWYNEPVYSHEELKTEMKRILE